VTDRVVLKWAVSVDDTPHKIGGGEIVHVACQYPEDPTTVTVWTVEPRNEGARVLPRTVQVYGTGQPLPLFAQPLGSTVAAGGRLVWHLFWMPQPDMHRTSTEVREPQPEEAR